MGEGKLPLTNGNERNFQQAEGATFLISLSGINHPHISLFIKYTHIRIHTNTHTHPCGNSAWISFVFPLPWTYYEMLDMWSQLMFQFYLDFSACMSKLHRFKTTNKLYHIYSTYFDVMMWKPTRCSFFLFKKMQNSI